MAKRIKTRMCISCRNRDEGSMMFRFVCDKQTGKAVLDLSGKAQGRGAYICRSMDCVNKAQKSGALIRNLNCQVDDELYDEIRSMCKDS